MKADGTSTNKVAPFERERPVDRDEARRRRAAKQRGRSPEHDAAAQEPEHDPVRVELRKRFFDPTMTTAYALDHEPPEREFVVDGLIPAREGGLIIGAGGAGKGHAQIRLAFSIATGQDFGSFTVPAPAKVLMVSREDDGDEIKRRLRAAVALRDPVRFGAGTEWRALLEQNFAFVDIRGIRGLSIESPELIDALGEKIAQLGGVKITMIDPLGRLVPDGVQLNTQEGAGCVHAAIDAMVAQLGCAISVAHHVSKIGRSTRPDEDRGAGASSGSHLLEDLSRYVLRLVPMSGADAKTRHDLDASFGYVEITAPKTNYSATPAPMVFRRRLAGALEHVVLRDERDVLDDRVLALLADAGDDGLTREAWEEACQNADPKIAVNKVTASRTRLLAANRIGMRDQEPDPNDERKRGAKKKVFFAL